MSDESLALDLAFMVRQVEIGDRIAGDEALNPADDLVAVKTPDGWAFTHKDCDV